MVPQPGLRLRRPFLNSLCRSGGPQWPHNIARLCVLAILRFLREPLRPVPYKSCTGPPQEGRRSNVVPRCPIPSGTSGISLLSNSIRSYNVRHRRQAVNCAPRSVRNGGDSVKLPSEISNLKFLKSAPAPAIHPLACCEPPVAPTLNTSSSSTPRQATITRRHPHFHPNSPCEPRLSRTLNLSTLQLRANPGPLIKPNAPATPVHSHPFTPRNNSQSKNANPSGSAWHCC